MRQVLYNHVKMSDAHSLFAKIYLQGAMMNVEDILTNTPEAGYLRNYLPGEKISNKGFVERLVYALCDKSLLHTDVHCTSDTKSKVLSTPQDKNREK